MEQKENNQEPTFKSYILLTVTFIISVAVAFCMLFVKDFTEDIKAVIVWAYVAVVAIYAAIAVFDGITSKNKSKKLKGYIFTMVGLNILAMAFFIISYLSIR